MDGWASQSYNLQLTPPKQGCPSFNLKNMSKELLSISVQYLSRTFQKILWKRRTFEKEVLSRYVFFMFFPTVARTFRWAASTASKSPPCRTSAARLIALSRWRLFQRPQRLGEKHRESIHVYPGSLWKSLKLFIMFIFTTLNYHLCWFWLFLDEYWSCSF